jgi:hypothetical protein
MSIWCPKVVNYKKRKKKLEEKKVKNLKNITLFFAGRGRG